MKLIVSCPITFEFGVLRVKIAAIPERLMKFFSFKLKVTVYI